MNASQPEQEALGYVALVRTNPNFRWLWFGQIVSLLGDWFNMVASVALLASLTDSGPALGSLFVVRMLAPFLTSPLAGVVADRYSRRSILIAADLARGCIVMGMLFVRSVEHVWLLYALTALQLGTSGFFFTARNAILPDLVDARALGTANAIASATWSAMLAIGAALGGFAAGWLGVRAAFMIDSTTFFISAMLIANIRQDACVSRNVGAAAGTAIGKYWEGLRYIATNPDVLVVTLHKSALTIFLGTTYRVVQASVAERLFPIGQQGSTSMGLLFATAGVGTAVGPLVTRCITGDDEDRLRWAMVFGYLAGGVGLFVSAGLASFEHMLAGAFFTGFGNGILWVFSTQLLMRRVDASVRGRVFGTEFAMFTLASAAGSGVVGVAMDTTLGISGVLYGMAMLSQIPGSAWTLWLVARSAKRTRNQHE